MKSLNDQEYLELLQKLVDAQYDDAITDYDIANMEWMPAEPEAKEQMLAVKHNGMIDLTHVRSGKIKEEIFKCSNLVVGDFKITVTRFNGIPSQQGAKLCCNLRIMGHQSRTMNGMPCNMDTSVDLNKDARFNGRSWLKYFNSNLATNVPIDTVVEIVRWMQAIKKLSAFT
jgi:hypothetical protein